MNKIKRVYNHIKQKKNLKKLTYFLILNISFMFVEVIYGLLSNSLGLLTDGAHMLLDSSAVIIGLYSEYLTDKESNEKYNFGYSLSEILGALINSIFLFFIAIYILFESIERLLSPRMINDKNLILVSFLGLVVNLVGVFYLHDVKGDEHHHHHHHNENTISISNSSEINNHNVDLNENEQEHKHHNHNIYAIYIHVLADTLGSVAVLISSFCIKFFSLYITDPICSFLISCLIIFSTLPVIKKSFGTLLHVPDSKISNIKCNVLNELNKNSFYKDNKVSVNIFNIWELNSKWLVAEMKLYLKSNKNNDDNLIIEEKNSGIDGNLVQNFKNDLALILENCNIQEHYIDII